VRLEQEKNPFLVLNQGFNKTKVALPDLNLFDILEVFVSHPAVFYALAALSRKWTQIE